MDNEISKEDIEVGTLIEQLQNASVLGKKATAEPDPLKKEQMETFVIEKAGELVRESMDFMKSMKDYVAASPNGEDMSALANLITATSSALETLNKLVLTDKKADTVLKVKEMDIKSRKEISEGDNTTRLLITREELFKQIINKSINTSTEIIDVSAIN